MATYIVLEEFWPEEIKGSSGCIWCGKEVVKNKAHIFSKRIIGANTDKNILKKTVCPTCNSFFGSAVEDFLFKKTPLGYLSDLFLNKKPSSLKWVPNYFWDKHAEIWIILIPQKDAYSLLPSQLMLTDDNQLATFLGDFNEETSFDENNEFIRTVRSEITAGNYSIVLSETYPENFYPRAFYLKEKLILTGKTQAAIDLLKNRIIEKTADEKFEVHTISDSSNLAKYQITFQWDTKLYIDYCAKIAYELYSLVNGSHNCQHHGFDSLRDIILNRQQSQKFDVSYLEDLTNRTFSSHLVPEGWIPYIDITEKITIHPLKETENTFNHVVFLYQLSNGFVCATIKLFNIPAVQIILGKSNVIIPFNCWKINFDLKSSAISFFKHIGEERIEALKETLYEHISPTDKLVNHPKGMFRKG